MRRYAWHGLLAVATATAVTVWACGGGGGGDSTAPATTGTVTGQVTLSGAALAGITAHLRRLGATGDARPAQTTDSQGRYTFTQVSPDVYRVFVDVPDTFTADPGPAEDTVTVEADMTATASTFELRLLAGTVAGTVTNTAGTALPNRTVALQKLGSTTDRTATTGGDGMYSLTNVTIGDYNVRVILACGEPGQTGPGTFSVSDGATSMADVEVTPRPSEMLLSCDVQPIFTRSCGFSGCHGGSFPEEGLNLSTASQTLNTAVNVQANQVTFDRVEPFMPEQDKSYLVCKIEATCPQRQGVRMPFGCSGASCLSTAQIDTIKTWIGQGAMNN